ncbi:hypothetical protein S7335_953 [Synechococcus sp. PCC 7335]|uniref:hypothetical protein n=1 Tax=Synechococcus sp. (strain ATCC 29403 / PCC 7335) TaxID=91464 RepID=UPI00017ECB83|nr:hypothetical protein [Synechococcus sp. PCC 7335]EDX82652.1 hypothetical protein S7335_953 [Synechococcus sp. PCC 7335]
MTAKLRLKKLNRLLPEVKSADESTGSKVIFLCLICSNVFTFVMMFWLAASVSRIANRQAPTLVQQVGGRAFVAKPVDYTYRDPQLLQKVAREWALLNYSFGNLPQIDHQTVTVSYDGNNLPEQTVTASYLLTDKTRDAYLKGFVENIYNPEAQSGNLSSLYMPYRISVPREINPGRWEVDVIGSRLITTPDNPSGELIPTNVRLSLVAAEVPMLALDQNPSPAAQATYRLLESGIRIDEITALKKG